MSMINRIAGIASALMLLGLAGWLLPTPGEAQAQPDGVEVRLAGMLHEDGRIEVALQYWWNGRWSPGVLPKRRYLPARADEDRWLVSAPVSATSYQSQVRLAVEHPRWDGLSGPGEFELRVDGQRFRSNCRYVELELDEQRVRLRTLNDTCSGEAMLAENRLATPTGRGRQDVRIAVRRSAGRVQLAVQHREESGWSERLVPADSWLPRQMSVGRWYHTFTVVVPAPAPAISGTLHRTAPLTVVDGEFQIETSGQRYRGNCGVLRLRSSDDAVLVDSLNAACTAQKALATICGPAMSEGDCDRQRNQAYGWEDERLRLDGADAIRLDLAEAQDVVDAIYRDYFPNGSRSPGVFRSHDEGTHYDGARHRIYLADWAMTLGVVLHETAHALIASASVNDPGHGGSYLALLLELWQRYLPIVDVGEARAAARADGLEVANSVSPLLRRVEGAAALDALLCTHPVRSVRLCAALAGELDDELDDSSASRFGGGFDDLWWFSDVDGDNEAAQTVLVRESREQLGGESVARLSISCERDQELQVEIWWRDLDAVPPLLFYRLGNGAWRSERWRTFSGGLWSGDEWGGHRAFDAASFLHELNWQSASHASLQVQRVQAGRLHLATFDLRGLFQTPVQADLVQCRAGRPALAQDVPIIDSGRSGDDFWWGVNEDEEPIGTYVVRDTAISGSAHTARLQIKCEQGRLELNVYWSVDQDLDWTILYRIAEGPVRQEEWTSGWGKWGDVKWKWTGREDADDLLADLAWAAQAGGTFTVEAHERGNPDRRYTARFDLEHLFETPVQPNLAACGR
ncbi:MAG: hypothetical protein OXD50_06835 [Chloroflexi bacterium]|nr:hypothetical protein [Chloroflexota bacterium]